MFSLASHRLARASINLPIFSLESMCRCASTASSSFSGPLSSGFSSRSFSTSSITLAGALRTCDVRLKRKFGAPPRRTTHPQDLRLHGTVTAFKHRRGYGFVLAEGVVPGHSGKPVYAPLDVLNRSGAAAEPVAEGEGTADAAAAAANSELLHKTYFFVRSSLDGGFYVMEGERVSFTVADIDVSAGTKRYLGAPAYASNAGSSGAEAAALAEEFSLDGAKSGDTQTTEAGTATLPSQHAEAMRLYDVRTNTESPITPITLYGKVVEWDDAAGRGMIAELDVHRHYHEDAPRFPFSSEDTDLGSGSNLFAGRLVRFCLGPASTQKGSVAGGDADEEAGDLENPVGTPADAGDGQLVAQRVIIDLSLERRLGAIGRPLAPATAVPGTVTDLTRFTGVVRDIRGDRYGFIIDDLSGESIFFHATNARASVREGDRVSYLLRELTVGKHSGKKGCFDVKRELGEAAGRQRNSAPTVSHAGGKDDADADFLLDEKPEQPKMAKSEFTSTSASRSKRPAAKSRSIKDIDFDTL